MSMVSHLLDLGSGPSRARNRLKEQTHPLGSAIMQMVSNRDQNTHVVNFLLPEAVLGGDLLSLLSGRLQELLGVRNQGIVISEPAVGKRSRSGAPVMKQKTVSRTTGSFKQNRLSGAEGTTQDSGPDDRREYGDSAARTSRIRAGALLAQVLEEYFLPVSTNISQSTQTASDPHIGQLSDAANQRSTLPTQGTGIIPGLTSSRNWPALSGQQVAERLQAFVTGGLHPEGDSALTAPGDSGRIEVNNTFHIHVNSAEESNPPDFQALSDQVAEILHQQAIQHGIDVT